MKKDFVDVQVGDYIVRNGRQWIVEGIYLGCEAQESVVGIKAVDRHDPCIGPGTISVMMVPIDLFLPTDVYRRVHKAA